MPTHPETEIAPYLSGELSPADQARVAAHLAGCATCRDTAAAFRTLLSDLAFTRPALDAGDGARYTAETWRKLGARESRPGPSTVIARVHRAESVRMWRVVPLALSGALAGTLLFLAVQGPVREGRVAELPVVEEAVLGQRLEMLREYPVVEKLDLLEDLEVIRNLDRLADAREGWVETPPDAG